MGDGGLKFNLGRTSKNGCVILVVGLSIWRMDKITPIFSEPGSCDDDTLRLGKKHMNSGNRGYLELRKWEKRQRCFVIYRVY